MMGRLAWLTQQYQVVTEHKLRVRNLLRIFRIYKFIIDNSFGFKMFENAYGQLIYVYI